MPNEDPKSGESHQVKLFFDVMSEAAGKAPTAEIHQIKTTSVFPPPPPPPAAPPKFARPAAPAPSGPEAFVPADGPQPPRSGFKLRAPKFNFMLLAIIGIIILLAAGSYFAYRYFVKRGEDEKTAALQAQSQKPPQQPLPAEWLKQYFGGSSCDLAVCGPDADPDQDGLKNTKELQYNTSPLNADSDFDGLADSDEVQIYNSDPLVADTDGDGFEDGSEVRNGYSPTTASQSPMSNMEKTVFSDNVASFGLHEPTKTFLTLVIYKTHFVGTSTTTPQLSLSVPKEWLIKESDAGVTFNSPQGDSWLRVVSLKSPAGEADLKSFMDDAVDLSDNKGKEVGSKIQKISGLSFHWLEYLTYTAGTQQPETHSLLSAFLKNNGLFMTVFNTKDGQWGSDQVLAQTVLNSIR